MSEHSPRTVTCGNCGHPIPDDTQGPEIERVPCARCSSTTRHVAVFVHDELTFHERLDMKAWHAGVKKPYLETRAGEVQQADGTWKHVDRVIDRENDLYREKVTDPATGGIHHFQQEPLSHHRSHGSAKMKKPPRN